MIGFIISALKIIFVLGFLILIHEGGHFLVAKLFKVNVSEFSIGFGKEIISRKKKETKYVLRMIPLGGYVNMLGEEERSKEEGSFSELSIPKRIAIVAAGGLVNIVFGIITYFVLMTIVANNFYSTKIDTIKEGYAAEIAGIQEDDEIIKIDGKKIHYYKDVSKILQKSNGETLAVEVKRGDETLEFDLKPTEKIDNSIGIFLGNEEDASLKIQYLYEGMPAEKEGIKVGDVITEVNGEKIDDYKRLVEIIDEAEKEVEIKVDRKGEEEQFTVPIEKVSSYYLGTTFKEDEKTIFNRLHHGFWETKDFCFSLIDNVKKIVTGNISKNQLMGPVGISNTVAKTSTVHDFVYLLALISLSLGITNLLPFPALDGGRILLLIIEWVRRKPLKENTEITIQLIGFSLLILLSIYVSYNDILRIF